MPGWPAKPGFRIRGFPFWLSVVLSGLLFWGGSPLAPGLWQVDLQAPNQVRFISTADLVIKTFRFEGVTDRIDGYLRWPGDTLQADKSEFYFEVDVSSFQTGIAKRDRDMRRWVLETHRWPISWYRGRLLQIMPWPEDSLHLKVQAAGTLFLHGIEKPLLLEATMEKRDGRLKISARFPVALPDFQIQVPRVLAAKVADTVQVQVQIFLEPIAQQ